MTKIKGIDVSAWNGKPDWAKVAQSGVRVAILRITEKNGIDTSFEHNFAGCKGNGIAIGVYKYSYSMNKNAIIEEAKEVVKTLGNRVIEYPVWLDLEWNNQRILPKSQLLEMIEAFRKIVVDAGYQFGIYCNKDWYNNVIPDKAKKYDFWIAGYPADDTGVVVERLRPTYGVAWQYSSKGRVQGISGSVDMNEFYKDYDNKKDVEMSEINKIYEVLKDEIGYLEKKSNAYLDDKTKNAGYNNITKYWRDITKRGRMKAYGYSATSGFVGGTDWPYCAAGLDDGFCRALGVERASELLLHGDSAFINCETMYNKAKAIKRIYSKPQVGSIVLFKKSNGVHYHTEFCYKVDSTYFYTIGFNTSGASTVVANGGGVCAKKYKIASTSADYYQPKYAESSADLFTDGATISVTLLKKGSVGDDVAEMQKKLNYLGYDCGIVDGEFGQNTYNALVAFQKASKIVSDGIYGEQSASALKTAYTAKYKAEQQSTRLYTGVCNQKLINVRAGAGEEHPNLSAYPHLAKGNQVDVMAYTAKDGKGQIWRYIRIAGKHYGYVLDSQLTKE